MSAEQKVDKPSSKNNIKEQFEKLTENFVSVVENHSHAAGIIQSNSALQAMQKTVIEQLKKLNFPSTKHEEWKYTNLKNLLSKSYQFGKKTSLLAPQIQEHIVRFEGLEANILVFVNGFFTKELSILLSPKEELTITNLAEAAVNQKDLIFRHFANYANYKTDAFTALNTAFAQDGAFIHVPAHTKVSYPIVLYFITDATNGNVMAQPRNLILTETGSEATIIETFNSFGSADSFTNIVTEIVVEKNADIAHYKIQNESSQASHIGTTQVVQQRDSKFADTTITLNGGLIRNNLNVVIDGQNCETFMNGLYMPTGSTHIDNHTLVDHAKPHSYSNELYKGIMDEKSTAVFNGKIYVRQEAQKTNAFQSNKNILLSENASVNSKPQLEIWADDVKCSHGCTTGALDEEPMFYLRSRGISEDNARALLMFAFAEDVLARIKVAPLKNYIEQVIEERLKVKL